METVLSDFVLVIYGIRNTVHIRFCRHRAVERGVEHRNHRHTGHDFSAALYASDVAGHMERAEFRILFANTDDFVVDDDGGLEVLAAVEHSVSYRADFVSGLDCAVNGIYHCFEHKFDGLGVILHVLLDIEHSAVRGFWVSSPPSNVIRSQSPLRIACSVSMSMSWYLSEELPALITRIFILYLH